LKTRAIAVFASLLLIPAAMASDSTRTEVDGNFAYAVVPVLYSYKEHGAPTQEEGQMTFALHRIGGGWKIQAWTWTGVKPHPAK
jgi:hypothetical protein